MELYKQELYQEEQELEEEEQDEQYEYDELYAPTDPCDTCHVPIFGTTEECKICPYYISKEDFPE